MSTAPTVPAAPPAHPPAHAPGFAAVCWYGTPFAFDRPQARAVALLWQDFLDGGHGVPGGLLVAFAGAGHPDARALFDGHPAWMSMIMPAVLHDGRPGGYLLLPPGGRPRPAG